MAITAAEILARVKTITKRTELTSIDTELLKVLLDLSKRVENLKSSLSGTLAADAYTITEPTDLHVLDCIDYGDVAAGTDSVLTEIPFRDYLNGHVVGFARRNGTIYVNPAPSSSKAYVLYYTKKHAESVVTIEFDEEFREAIEYGVAAKVFGTYGLTDKVSENLQLYENEIGKLRLQYIDDPNIAPISRLN